ncbi:MAG: type 4a pilus biogenesis protein PilO [Candidatus Omnitrophica bacterium]|nr:type 4a pilus biogenesis protein PilO [Candidatus Omnitrophota bacterium]
MKIPNIHTFYAFVSRLSKRERIIFYLAASFISLTLLDRLIISPIHSKIKSLNEEIQERESAIKKNLHILSQKDRISSEILKYASFLNSAKSEEEEITALLKEIEDLANKSSIYLVDMKPAGLKSTDSSKKYLISLNCEAQMEHLSDFMYNIENSNKLLIIERYQISPKSKESSVATCSISVAKIVMP